MAKSTYFKFHRAAVLLALVSAVIFGIYHYYKQLADAAPDYINRLHAATSADTSVVATQQVRATFLGTSSLLLADGEHQVMIDGFFTRPSLGEILFGQLEPDRELIRKNLLRLNSQKLDVIAVVHSHHDHAMDAPEIAMQTGAQLFGSESTANIARGYGLPEQQISAVATKGSIKAGHFTVTLIRSRHTPMPAPIASVTGIDESIDTPLQLPARLTDYKEGGSFSVLIEHPAGNVLIQASSGFIDGALKDIKADVVFLGIAGLSKRTEAYRQQYLDEVVNAVQASRVYPIHWDNFMKPLDEGLVPLTPPLDDIQRTLEELQDWANVAPTKTVQILQAWQTVRLY